MKRPTLLLSALVLLVIACEQTETPTQVDPSFLIQDAAQNGGNEHFYWLPPIVKHPSFDGVFDGSHDPLVEICEWLDLACVQTVASFDLSSGVVVVPEDEAYEVQWHTGLFNLDAGKIYRTSVRVYGMTLGFFDVVLVNNGGELKDINRDEYIPLVDNNGNRTLNIRFRIEEGIEPPPPAASVGIEPSSASLTGVGSTIQLSATAWDEGGVPIPGKDPSWRSLNPAIAVVDPATGLVTVVGGGQVAIEAEVDGITDYAILTNSVSYASKAFDWQTLDVPGGKWCRGVWGFSDEDVWVACTDGLMLHYNGVGWEEHWPSERNLHNVWGWSPDDFWVAGIDVCNGQPCFLHNEGGLWTGVPSDQTGGMWALWGPRPDDIWAGGEFQMLHYEGGTWEEALPTPGVQFFGLWGTSEGEIWASAYEEGVWKWSGEGWNLIQNASQVTDIRGTAPDDLWVVSNSDPPLHFDGTQWTPFNKPSGDPVWESWMFAPDDIWTAAEEGFWHFDGSGWTKIPTPVPVNCVWGTPKGDLFAASYGKILIGTRVQ